MSESPKTELVEIDPDRFDDLQIRLLEEICSDIKSAFAEAGLDDEEVREYTENMAFGIAAIVDGSRVMDIDGAEVQPVLTFAVGENGEKLIGAGGGSWMHEYTFGVTEEIFGENDSQDEVLTIAEKPEQIETESEIVPPVANADSYFDLVVSFRSGLNLGCGCFELEDADELAQEVSSNMHFLISNELDHSSPTDVTIKSLCPAFETIEHVVFKIDNREWKVLKKESLADQTFESFAEIVNEFVRSEIG